MIDVNLLAFALVATAGVFSVCVAILAAHVADLSRRLKAIERERARPTE